MRASWLSTVVLTVALTGCKKGDGEDTGDETSYPTGCITSSSGGSYAFLADAVLASSDGATITLCPTPVEETVEIYGKALRIVGTPQTTWEPPANQPAAIVDEGAAVEIDTLTVLSTRNGFEVDGGSSLTVANVSFDAPGNYAIAGKDAAVTLTDVAIDNPGWGGVSLAGAAAELTATRVAVTGSEGNAVTLSEGASGSLTSCTVATTLCTNDGQNCLESDGWGVEISDGGTLTLAANTFTDNLLGGVRAESATVSSTDDALSGNFIGMWLENATATLDGTAITDTIQYGILGVTLTAELTDVTLSSSPAASFYEELDDDTDGDGVPDANATLDGTYGIVGFDSDIVGDGVEVRGHNGGGIYMTTRLDTAVSLDLANAIIDDNAEWGIFAQLGEVTLTDTDITNTRNHDEYCIDLVEDVLTCNAGYWGVASDLTWTGGTLSGNEYVGILAALNSQVLTGLTIEDNADIAVRVQNSALSLSQSTVRGTGPYGVALSQGAVAAIDDVDFQDRSHVLVRTFSDGSTYATSYEAYELLVVDSTATVTNSRFARGERGLRAQGTSTLAVEDSSFDTYNSYVLYALTGAEVTATRTTFDNMGTYTWFCSGGTLTAQTARMSTVAPSPVYSVTTGTDGTESISDYTRSAPAIYASNCTLDLSSVVMEDVTERAISTTNGSVQLDGVTVGGAGASASSSVGAVNLAWTNSPADALVNELTVTGVTTGDAVKLTGSSAQTTGTVRLTSLSVGVEDADQRAGVAGAGLRADHIPDLRVSGLHVEGTAGSALIATNSGVTVDGTALGADGVVTSPGADAVSVTGGTAALSNLAIATPTGVGIRAVDSALTTAGITVTGATASGLVIDGGAGHDLATTTVTGAGEWGMECLSAPSFDSCATTLSVDGALGVHSGCDDCATLAGF